MKTAAKIFIIIGMVCGFWCIAPLIVGFFALDKLETARTKNELTGMAICTLLLCNTVAGILMLCMPESELAENGNGFNQQPEQNSYPQQNRQNFDSQPKPQAKESEVEIVANLDKLKRMKEQGILSDEEYEKLRKREVDKLFNIK